jgi:hypothetical protein
MIMIIIIVIVIIIHFPYFAAVYLVVKRVGRPTGVTKHFLFTVVPKITIRY